jgi:hypothetical protein
VAAIMQRLDTMAAQQMQQLTQKMDSIEQRMELKMSGIEQVGVHMRALSLACPSLIGF